jgi:hypothetical protein
MRRPAPLRHPWQIRQRLLSRRQAKSLLGIRQGGASNWWAGVWQGDTFRRTRTNVFRSRLALSAELNGPLQIFSRYLIILLIGL